MKAIFAKARDPMLTARREDGISYLASLRDSWRFLDLDHRVGAFAITLVTAIIGVERLLRMLDACGVLQ
jgi:hypothetical protein